MSYRNVYNPIWLLNMSIEKCSVITKLKNDTFNSTTHQILL